MMPLNSQLPPSRRFDVEETWGRLVEAVNNSRSVGAKELAIASWLFELRENDAVRLARAPLTRWI
jgi:hypothetical protein